MIVKGISYDHVITLKDPAHNVFLGSERGHGNNRGDHVARLLTVTSGSGLIGFEVDWNKLAEPSFRWVKRMAEENG